jgi:hypothetical protein
VIIPLLAVLLVLPPGATGGGLRRYANVRIRHGWVVAVALAAQVLVIEVPRGRSAGPLRGPYRDPSRGGRVRPVQPSGPGTLAGRARRRIEMASRSRSTAGHWRPPPRPCGRRGSSWTPRSSSTPAYSPTRTCPGSVTSSRYPRAGPCPTSLASVTCSRSAAWPGGRTTSVAPSSSRDGTHRPRWPPQRRILAGIPRRRCDPSPPPGASPVTPIATGAAGEPSGHRRGWAPCLWGLLVRAAWADPRRRGGDDGGADPAREPPGGLPGRGSQRATSSVRLFRVAVMARTARA